MKKYVPKVGDLVRFDGGVITSKDSVETIMKDLVYRKNPIKELIKKTGGKPESKDFIFKVVHSNLISMDGMGIMIRVYKYHNKVIEENNTYALPEFSCYPAELIRVTVDSPSSKDKLLLAIKKTYGT